MCCYMKFLLADPHDLFIGFLTFFALFSTKNQDNLIISTPLFPYRQVGFSSPATHHALQPICNDLTVFPGFFFFFFWFK